MQSPPPPEIPTSRATGRAPVGAASAATNDHRQNAPGRSGFSRDGEPRFRRAALAALAVCMLAAFTAHAESAADIAAIRAAADDWVTAFKAGDIDALMALYMPDAFVALHGQPAMRGVDAIRAYFEPKMGTAEVEFLLEYEQVEVHGDMAHLVSKYWYTAVAKDGSETYRDAGRSALIYKRDTDGRWKIYLDIDQATPDVGFPAPTSRLD